MRLSGLILQFFSAKRYVSLPKHSEKTCTTSFLTVILQVEETSNVPNAELHPSSRNAFVDQREAVESDGLGAPETAKKSSS